MSSIFKVIFFLLLAAVTAVAGLLLPVQVLSIDPDVLEYAHREEISTREAIDNTLQAAHAGPARLLLDASDLPDTARPPFENRLRKLLESEPKYRLSGGPAPEFEAFIEDAGASSGGESGIQPALPQLLPRSVRNALSESLASSRNPHVSAFLEVRNLRGMKQLYPADHAAGAPYDAAVLTLGLLLKGEHFPTGAAATLAKIARNAAEDPPSKVEAMESLAASTLSLARQLDYRSLANLAALADSPGAWKRMAELFRNPPLKTEQLYAALHYGRDPEALDAFIEIHEERGIDSLEQAFAWGPASLRYLLKVKNPIYRPQGAVEKLLDALSSQRPAVFMEFAYTQRPLALAVKFLAFIVAGLWLALMIGALWRSNPYDLPATPRSSLPVIFRNIFLALVVAITIWIIFEPGVLNALPSTKSAPNTEAQIDFSPQNDTVQSLQSPMETLQELDTVTLLILALFFILQLLIYTFCLIKLREIRKQRLSPDMKIKLLENEEHLFDFGLYAGLGGTVLALIFVAVGIVEASLMAAYASTLFGILFVALLKVAHLRPYKRKLILQTGSSHIPGSPASAQHDRL